MPIYIPKERLTTIAIWDIFQKWLEDQDNPKIIYRRLQGPTYGLVIGWWRNDVLPWPTHYLQDLQEATGREGGTGGWGKFDDDREQENPMQYAQYSRALAAIQKLREAKETQRIGLIFWTHPEAFLKPLDFCIELQEANRFPGSVTA